MLMPVKASDVLDLLSALDDRGVHYWLEVAGGSIAYSVNKAALTATWIWYCFELKSAESVPGWLLWVTRSSGTGYQPSSPLATGLAGRSICIRLP